MIYYSIVEHESCEQVFSNSNRVKSNVFYCATNIQEISWSSLVIISSCLSYQQVKKKVNGIDMKCDFGVAAQWSVLLWHIKHCFFNDGNETHYFPYR